MRVCRVFVIEGSSKTKNLIAHTYNAAVRKLGDENPDFLEAVYGLTVSECQRLNEQMPDVTGVYYQSVDCRVKNKNGRTARCTALPRGV